MPCSPALGFPVPCRSHPRDQHLRAYPHARSQRQLPAGRRHALGARLQRLAQRHQGHGELVRQRRVRPAVRMGQGNELPHGAVQRGPLCGHVPLGVGLGVRHLAPSLGVHLGDLGRQRLDTWATSVLRACTRGSCGSAKAQPG